MPETQLRLGVTARAVGGRFLESRFAPELEMPHGRRVWISCVSLLALLLPLTAAAQPRSRPGEYIVRYRSASAGPERAAARSQSGVALLRSYPRFGMELVRAADGGDAATRLARDPRVLYVEPNWEYQADRLPDDPRFPELYSLLNVGQNGGLAGADIRATRAWDVFTGDPELKIGVIDTGVDYNHPELAANIWTNPGEIPGNGVDDDGNGYADDIHGWNAAYNNGDPMDDNGHGTHVSGTIAAVGNNGAGITGVCWRARIVAIKFLNSRGNGASSEALTALDYAIATGVRVTNNSWGGGAYSQALLDAINMAGDAGQLFVASAGNTASDNDVSPQYPASYPTSYVIAVAATDNRDRLSSFSNYGAHRVHLAAPGNSILSLSPGGGYQVRSGTSMAAPHVTGVVALAFGQFPLASNLVIRQQLLASADRLPALTGKVETGGRLNAFVTLAEPDSIPPGVVGDLAIREATSSGFVLDWTATGDDGSVGRATRVDLRWSWAPIVDEAGFADAHPITTAYPEESGTPQTFEVRSLAPSSTYWLAMRVNDEFGNAGPLSNNVTGTTLEPPVLEYGPASVSAEVFLGAETETTLTLRNAGPGTLDFSIPTPEIAYAAPPVFEPMPTQKNAPDARVGPPVLDGRGGPDAFGYRWSDSRESGGPVYAWQDISKIGTRITLAGDEASTSGLPIGFDFPFYGDTFSLLRITTNGYISLTETNSQYDNQPLPSPAAPQNLIAPFWDDLILGGISNVYLYSDGTRCIVTWERASHFPAGGPFTFQAILEPTGAIVFQYGPMGEPRNEGTVGIQNATRLDGLTVAFNTDYVDSGLAVRVVPTQQWLTVTPSTGRLAAGESRDLRVGFRTFGLDGGQYQAALDILTNDPGRDSVRVPASLRVIGAPDLRVIPSALDFGIVFLGRSANRELTVTNTGSDRLDITSIASADPDLRVSPAALIVNPREVKRLTVTYEPTAVRNLVTDLVFTSNDPDAPAFPLPVRGVGQVAPSILIEPDSLHVALGSDQIATRTLRVTNSGGSDYQFSAEAIRAPLAAPPIRPDGRTVRPERASGEPRLQRTGGPDAFGYTFRDSDEPGGPVFAWEDIRNSGIQLQLQGEDGNVGPLPLGFDFPFYGATFSEVRVCLNGWLSFTNSSSGRANYPVPSAITVAPENLIAPMWDDLAFGAQRRAWYRADASRVIVQFQDVFRSGEPASFPNTFQAILYPNGTIVFQYQRLAALNLQSATVGIQNATRDDGLEVVFDAPYLRDSLAVRIQPPTRFVAVSPASGVVPPGGFLDLDVRFDATALFGGGYDGSVRVTGNDPGVPEHSIPVRLDVTGAPAIAFGTATLDFGEVFAGFPELRALRVTNVGTDLLQVSDVTFDDPAYGVDRTQFTVPPLATTELFVTLGALDTGEHPATLTLRSNDADKSRSRLALAGRIAPAPILALDAPPLLATLAIPETTTRTLTLRNQGGSDLHVSISTLFDTGVLSRTALTGGRLDPVPVLIPREEATPAGPGKRNGLEVAGSPRAAPDAHGGPDAFGYNWRDSDQEGGPAFGWVDIQTIGTPIAVSGSGNDETAEGLPLGFDFPFYGTVHRTVNLCTNGWLSFTGNGVSSTNQALPSTLASSPENLLAVFWDDLNPGNSAVRMWAWSDSTRFVASWIAVLRSGSGGPYTFQVVLEASGRILYQYRSMKGVRLGEATVGIQNASRDDGLTVVHDAPYLHDSLAVEFRPVPEFVRVDPQTAVVPAGGSAEFQVTFDTHGLFGATYGGALRVATDDPERGVVLVPIQLDARGVPQLAATPAVLEFGTLFATASAERTIRLRNDGTDTLRVRSFQIVGHYGVPDVFEVVAAPTLPFAMVPRYPVDVTVRFAPGVPCDPCGELLVVGSDDPDREPFGVALSGIALPAPELEGLPAALEATVTSAAPLASRTVVLRNSGGSDLEWSVSSYSGLPAVPPVDAAANADEPFDAHKGVDGAPGGAVVAASGGPDAFGYRWADSDDPAGVPFDWQDITTTGFRLPLETDDQSIGPIALPFRFPFYGQWFDSIRVCSNGWLSFTSIRTNYQNVSLPNAGFGIPENLIAPFWDDLTYNVERGDAFGYYDGEKLTFSFHRVRRYGGDAFVTFQVLLYPNGTMDFQYLDMQGRTDNATIGIQNASRNIGLQIAFNTPYARNGLRTRIAPRGGWLTVSRSAGRIAPGASDTIEVRFDGAAYGIGNHPGLLRFATNDVDEPLVDVPCLLEVSGAARSAPVAAAAAAAVVAELPRVFGLALRGGNPLRGEAALVLALPAGGAPEVGVYDVRGRRVRRLSPGPLAAGRHVVRWDGNDAAGAPAAPGVYFARASVAGEPVRVVRLVRLR